MAELREIDLIALAGLLHDIGKFGQRADIYQKRDAIYNNRDYKYTHAAYTAQILNEQAFNLGEEMSDNAAMHHNPQSDEQWIIAAADRMASGFEREIFEDYNTADSESFKQQRLWHLFDDEKRYKIAPLSVQNIFAAEEKTVGNEYDALWQSFEEDLKKIRKRGNSLADHFTIDYLLKKYTTFIPSSTTFQKGSYQAVKANIPLYDHGRATAIFAAAIYKLYKEQNNTNILDYSRTRPADMEQQDLLYISGDFFGIQNFIFADLPTSKAAKILRAKSAYVQLLTHIVALELVERLGLSYQSIVSSFAGKFEILGVHTPEAIEVIETLQKELNDFFVREHFGITGIGLSSVPCALADFIEKGRYQKELRARIGEAVELQKFKKFDLLHRDPLLEVDEGLDNQNLCQLCSRRKGRKREYGDTACDGCDHLVRIGEKLAKSDFLTLSKGSGQIALFGRWYLNFSEEPKRFDNAVAIYDIRNDDTFRGYAKWELKSYVATDEKEEIVTFEELAEASVPEGKNGGKRAHGVEALMALKGDVDNMGAFIKESDVTASFARYNFFARMVDYFFGSYTTTLMRSKPLYTVFAGGDDIFLLGAWDSVIEIGKEIREEFLRFAQGSPLSFSAGFVMSKPGKPVNFIAQKAEEALKEAKALEGKDAVTLFDECVKWKDYLNGQRLKEGLEAMEESDQTTAFLYRLLEFVTMSKRVKEGDITATMWKSKFAYTVRRNMESSISVGDNLYRTIDEMIEKYPKETKMILSEIIYKRRKRS